MSKIMKNHITFEEINEASNMGLYGKLNFLKISNGM